MESIVIKQKDRFLDHSVAYRLKLLGGYASLLRSNAAFLARWAAGNIRPLSVFSPMRSILLFLA